MKKFLITICCLFTIIQTSIAQIPIGKAILEYQIERAEKNLTINGGGVRSMFFLELYSAGLYLQEKSSDPIAIAYADETMSIRIKITSKLVTKKTMTKAIEEGFVKATDGQTEKIQDRINQIVSFYAKEFKKGDILELVYVKEKGTICMLNEEELGVIPGQDFKFALYKIWLGEQPVSTTLKKGMLAIENF